MKFKLYSFKEKEVNVMLPPEVKAGKMDVDYDEVLKKHYGKIVKYFVDTITKIPNVDFSYLYNNLNTLTIKKERPYTTGPKAYRFGSYYAKRNLLCIYKITAIYHELLHMASNYYWKEKDQLFTGFQQSLTGAIGSIGCGLNEGYTEMLVNRHFGNKDLMYDEEMTIASMVEFAVGEEKMTQLYFRADLKGLMDEIQKYAGNRNVRKFIKLVDCICDDEAYEGCTEDETYGLAYGFALSIVANKLFMQYDNDEIEYDTLRDKLKYFYDMCDGYLSAETRAEIILEADMKNTKKVK